MNGWRNGRRAEWIRSWRQPRQSGFLTAYQFSDGGNEYCYEASWTDPEIATPFGGANVCGAAGIFRKTVESITDIEYITNGIDVNLVKGVGASQTWGGNSLGGRLCRRWLKLQGLGG